MTFVLSMVIYYAHVYIKIFEDYTIQGYSYKLESIFEDSMTPWLQNSGTEKMWDKVDYYIA
jgi:hypothetical protein